MRFHSTMTTYADVYGAWQDDPEAFWLKAAEGIDWIKAPSKALDDTNAPFYRWFSDTVCNTCWNAVDPNRWWTITRRGTRL